MHKLIGLIGLASLRLCGPAVANAAAAGADVTYVITNGGVDVKAEGRAHFVAHGNHDGPAVHWSKSALVRLDHMPMRTSTSLGAMVYPPTPMLMVAKGP